MKRRERGRSNRWTAGGPAAARAIALFLALLVGLLAGCVRPASVASLGGGQAPLGPGGLPAIVGQVRFGAPAGPFTTQATMSDIANLATVSLLDNSTNKTVNTTVTDPTGMFSLGLSGFVPATGTVYVLEAVRGLTANAAGNDAARVRTLLVFQNGGWTSPTNLIPNSGVVLDVGTTALAGILNLRTATSFPVATPSALIGTLQPDGQGHDTYAPPAGTLAQGTIQPSEFASASSVVSQALAVNRDPIETLYLDTTNWIYYFNNGTGPAITSIVPNTGVVGSTVTLYGANFSLTPANDVIKFNGATAAVPSFASYNKLVTTVPTAVTGPVTLTIGNVTFSANQYYYVVPTISGIAPGSATASSLVTVTGTGFDPNPLNDTVTIAGQACTVTAATPTALTVRVPRGATTAPVVVTTAGGTATSAVSLVVLPTLETMNLTRGTAISAGKYSAGGTITITGTGFLPGPTNVTFYAFGSNTAIGPFAATALSSNSLQVAMPLNQLAVMGPNRTVISTAAGNSNTGLFNAGASHNVVNGTSLYAIDYYNAYGFNFNIGGALPISNPAANYAMVGLFGQQTTMLDGSGHLWTSCGTGYRNPDVQEYTPNGTAVTAQFYSNNPAGTNVYASPIAQDGMGNIYVGHRGDAPVPANQITRIAVGAANNSTATNWGPVIPNSQIWSVCFDSGGNLLASDANNNCIWKIDSTGGFYTQYIANTWGFLNFDNQGNLDIETFGTPAYVEQYNPVTGVLNPTWATVPSGGSGSQGGSGLSWDNLGQTLYGGISWLNPKANGTTPYPAIVKWGTGGGAATNVVTFDSTSGLTYLNIVFQ